MHWYMLPLRVDGPLLFGYATVAGPAGPPTPLSVTVNGQTLAFPATLPTDWYVVAANCDVDNSGPGISGSTNLCTACPGRTRSS